VSRKSKLSQWWQKQTGEVETPFDSDSSAFFTSVMIHVVILIGLGLWPFIIASDKDEIILTTTSVDISEVTEAEPPEQIHFSEQQMDEVGANSDRGTQMALAQAAIISDVSEIPNPADPSDSEVAEILLNNQVVRATGLQFSETLMVKGAVGEGTTGASGAVDRITHEILQSLEERRTLIIWLFDQSGSLIRQREQIHDRFDNIYTELGILEAAKNEAFAAQSSKPLLTQIMAFGKNVSTMMKEPSDDLDEIKSAVRAIPQDDSGIELTFEAIFKAVNGHSKYRALDAAGEPKRKVMVVVVSDEAGEDQQHVDKTVRLCQKLAVPIYVIGVPAPFGRQETMVKWIDPDPTYDQTPQWGRVNQGPESAMPERIKLHFAGEREDKDPIDSGFGPWALTRLCYETSGIYFAVHPNRNVNRAVNKREVASFTSHLEHFFDPSIMRDYRPDYVAYREYDRRIQASKMRSSLIQAARLSWSTPMKDPRLKFVKRDEATFANELSESQKMAAQLEPQINEIYQILQIGNSDRKTENSLRWQAAYDLALGRVLATKVRTETYNAMLAAAKRGLNPSEDKNNTWILVPANEISVGSQYSKAGEKATELLNRVAQEHPGTPWALLAERELANPIGWRWQDSFTDLTPRRTGAAGGAGNNNAAAANEAARMIKKPPPKRRPPKL
jgi:hypothetical protein